MMMKVKNSRKFSTLEEDDMHIHQIFDLEDSHHQIFELEDSHPSSCECDLENGVRKHCTRMIVVVVAGAITE